MIEEILKDLLIDLEARKLVSYTARRIDLKHLLSAERAARGSFYATRVGFVAINPKGHRIARAHNGFPIGVSETRERWSKSQKDFYHLHAECAGVLHGLRYGYACKGASAYVTHPPCPGCMRLLIGAGFTRVVFGEQSLAERMDWREDMLKSFELAKAHNIEMMIYRDAERSLKHADITRTELELKKVYDVLLPQARWSSHDKREISPATKPESPEWLDHPVIVSLLACAREGVMLKGKGAILQSAPECRAATALIQSGVAHIIIVSRTHEDPRWAQAVELERAEEMLKGDAHIRIDFAAPHQDVKELFRSELAGTYLDTRTQAVKMI
jgi:dCMP deaminase